MSISQHLTTFANLPIRDFSPRGFVLLDDEAGFEVDEKRKLEMPDPCAVRVNGEAMMGWRAEGLGCCVGPILGLVVFAVFWIVTKGFFEAIGAGVLTCLVIFIPWSIYDERRRASRRRQIQQEMESEIDELAVLGDNRDEVVRVLNSMPSLTAMSLARLIHCGVAEATPALIINFERGGDHFPELSEMLIQASPFLPNLKALFINELTVDECEISWIINDDCTPILIQFPQLNHFQIRGSGTRFVDLKLHCMETLIVESGGLGHEAIEDLRFADLPNLQHLEIWTGQEDFGGSCESRHIIDLLTHQRHEQLRHLGIRNCEFADEVIEWLVRSPLIEQLESVDFSLGCVSDRGAQSLLDCAAVRNLKSLDLHYHYISEPWMQQLRSLPIDVNTDEPQEPDDIDDDGEPLRYSAVGE